VSLNAERSNDMKPRAGLKLAAPCLGLSLLAGCAHPQIPVASPPVNPFAAIRASALCEVTPVAIAPNGAGTAKMSVRSDDGACAIKVAQPDASSYGSFVLTTLPDHGKAFIYNYYNATYISYTATTAYAGGDHFAVSLIPGQGRPRVPLSVDVTVQAGVGVAPPAEAAPAPVAAPTTTHRSTTHHTTSKKKAVKKTTSK
jgi:hypothetical protein